MANYGYFQAVRCALCDISPHSVRYNMAAVKYFASLVEEKVLKMVIQDIKDGILLVMLFSSNEDADICINSSLVEENHARKSGGK